MEVRAITEPTPRPRGLHPDHPWVAREPRRNKAAAAATAAFLELLDRTALQPTWAAIRRKLRAPQPPLRDVPAIPAERGAWTFAAIGDYGHTSIHSARVAANLLKAHPALIVTTGDNVYATGREIDYQRNWEPNWRPVADKIKMYPSVGNHDLYRDDLTAYFKRFPHIDGRSFYTFTNKNAQFFSLNTDEALTPGSPQLAWLDRELGASKTPWKVVYMHYPAYGGGRSYSELRENLQPLLAKHGVQLVLAGHEHWYSRAKPQDGVMHVVTGGGGQSASVHDGKLKPWQEFAASAHHHLEVSVGPTKLVVQAIDELGRRFDTFVVPLRGAVADAARGAQQLAA